MGHTPTKYSANARVYILMDNWEPDNPTVHGNKTLFKVNHFISVDSKLSIEGGGSAQVVFNDFNMKFKKYVKFKYINSKEWGDERLEGTNSETLLSNLTNLQEIGDFRKHLTRYASESDALRALKVLAGEQGLNGGVLLPLVTTQNLIWIHYLGRDGYWYAGFTGIITRISITESKNKTPIYTVSARTPDVFFENSPIAIRTKNVGGASNPVSDQSKVEDVNNLAFTNIYSGKITSEIIVDVLDKVNRFFLNFNREDIPKSIDGKLVDYRYYKLNRLIGFGKNTTPSVEEQLDENKPIVLIPPIGEGQKGYDINNPLFENKRWHWEQTLDIKNDFYTGSEIRKNSGEIVNAEEGDWLQLVMDKFFHDEGDNVKPFQNLIATNLQLFTVDKMSAKEVLDIVKKSVFCYMYFSGDGNFRVERPYFDIHLGMLDSSVERTDLPPDYDLRYLITKLDASYLSHNYSEDSSNIVTRTETDVKPDWLTFAPEITKLAYTGKSESSWKTTFKFGEKQIQLNSIVSPKYAYADSGIKDKLLRSYCFAMRMILSSNYRQLAVKFDQRPDIQLNRDMLFLDEGVYFLTKDISQHFTPQEGRLTTDVTGTFVRPVGFQLVNPYRFIINGDGTLSDWETVKKITDPSLSSSFGKTTEKNNPFEVGADGETFDKLEGFCKELYNSNQFPIHNNESGKTFDTLFSSEGEEKRPYILCFRGVNSNHTDRQDFTDDLYLILPATKEFKKINSEMSCGDAQSAGTHITFIESNYVVDKVGTRPSFNSYTRLAEGVYRYSRQGTYWICSDFEYYNLSSEFRTSGDAIKNKTVLIGEDGKKKEIPYLSFMGADCNMNYNQGSSANTSWLNQAEPKGKWWEGVNIFGKKGSSFDSVMQSITTANYIDVFIKSYNAGEEEQIKEGLLEISQNQNILNFSESQKLFLALKCIQKDFKKIKNKKWVQDGLPADLTVEQLYGGNNSPKSFFGMYNVSDAMTGFTGKDLSTFKNTSNITEARSKQDQWFSSYFNQLISVLNQPILNGQSLNTLFDLMSQLNIDSDGNTKKIPNDGNSLALNYPEGTAKNFPIIGNRGALVALLHIFLQITASTRNYNSYSASDATQFAVVTNDFFSWEKIANNYSALSGGQIINIKTPVLGLSLPSTASSFTLGAGTLTYRQFFELFKNRVVI